MNYESIAKVVREVNKAYFDGLTKPYEDWDNSSGAKKYATVDAVVYLAERVRLHQQSVVAHQQHNDETTPPPAILPMPNALELHTNWVKAKENDGWVFGATTDETTKTNTNLIGYENLPKEQQMKYVLFVQIVISLFPYLP